jgi:asparagine N-glycosylation enzyme membrane subunit Stt3
MRKIADWLHFGWNWQGAIVALVLLGLVVGDLALFGHTAAGYVGVAVIVVVSAVLLRFEIGQTWLHR